MQKQFNHTLNYFVFTRGRSHSVASDASNKDDEAKEASGDEEVEVYNV